MIEEKPHGKQIVDALGGVTAVADYINALPDPNMKITPRAVHSWASTGIIPEKYRPSLLRMAKEKDKPHHAVDYIAHLMNI